jgi:hypothetical protein
MGTLETIPSQKGCLFFEFFFKLEVTPMLLPFAVEKGGSNPGNYPVPRDVLVKPVRYLDRQPTIFGMETVRV